MVRIATVKGTVKLTTHIRFDILELHFWHVIYGTGAEGHNAVMVSRLLKRVRQRARMKTKFKTDDLKVLPTCHLNTGRYRSWSNTWRLVFCLRWWNKRDEACNFYLTSTHINFRFRSYFLYFCCTFGERKVYRHWISIESIAVQSQVLCDWTAWPIYCFNLCTSWKQPAQS